VAVQVAAEWAEVMAAGAGEAVMVVEPMVAAVKAEVVKEGVVTAAAGWARAAWAVVATEVAE